MTPIEQVREALMKARTHVDSDRTEAILYDRSAWADLAEESLEAIDAALAILKDVEAQEPVIRPHIVAKTELHMAVMDWRHKWKGMAVVDIAKVVRELSEIIDQWYPVDAPSAPVELSEEDVERMLHQRRLKQEQSPTCVSVTQDVIGYRDAIIDITKHYTLHRKP